MTKIGQNCNLKVISSQNVLFYSPERYNIDHTGSKNSLESTKDPGNEQLSSSTYSQIPKNYLAPKIDEATPLLFGVGTLQMPRAGSDLAL